MFTTTVTIFGNGQLEIPKSVFKALDLRDGMELTLTTAKSGIMLVPKRDKHKLSAKSLRGCLQHIGNPIPANKLCKPVEYIE